MKMMTTLPHLFFSPTMHTCDASSVSHQYTFLINDLFTSNALICRRCDPCDAAIIDDHLRLPFVSAIFIFANSLIIWYLHLEQLCTDCMMNDADFSIATFASELNSFGPKLFDKLRHAWEGTCANRNLNRWKVHNTIDNYTYQNGTQHPWAQCDS